MLTKCIWTSHKTGFFKEIYFLNLKIYLKYQKIPTFTAFILLYSLEGFKTIFNLYEAPSKKKYARSEVFFPYWVVWIQTGLAK